MAASATMQSMFLASSLARLSSKSTTGGAAALPSLAMRRSSRRNAKLTVRNAVQEQEAELSETSASSFMPPTSSKNKASFNIIDLMEFSSPAPERINGRLAMLGFVSAIAAELLSGQDVFSQISHGGFQLFLGASIVFSIASFVPFFKGVDPESKSDGLMNSDAELLNGRLAMLGLVALAVTEFAKGGALV